MAKIDKVEELREYVGNMTYEVHSLKRQMMLKFDYLSDHIRYMREAIEKIPEFGVEMAETLREVNELRDLWFKEIRMNLKAKRKLIVAQQAKTRPKKRARRTAAKAA